MSDARPFDPIETFTQAVALQNQGCQLEALALYDELVGRFMCPANVHTNRGLALAALQRHEEAIIAYERALERDINDAAAHYSLGLALFLCRRYPEAISSFTRAAELSPIADAYVSRGAAHTALLNDEHAIADFEKAIELAPQLAGKSVLLWSEEGVGDVMQFCRYAPLLARVGAQVSLAVDPSLLRLLKHSFAQAPLSVIADSAAPESTFDFQCAILSLPLVCQTDQLEQIPARTPYLFAEDAATAMWREYVFNLSPHANYRVGLVWAGARRLHETEMWHVDAARSLPLGAFEPLLARSSTQALQFFSLQLGASALKNDDPLVPLLIDLTPHLQDWADTAALIANLDLVISCDTAVAHLAAAMGKPTWILSRHNGCWRWLLDRDDSPWYPTVRLFRQPAHGDWASVMANVTDALAAQLAAQPVLHPS